MALKASKNLIFYLGLFFICLFYSCANVPDSELPKDDDQNVTQNAPVGLPPGLPSYPYIFNGTFYLNGEKGGNNSKIKSMLGELDSPIILSKNSTFENLIIGPRNKEDIKNNVEFYLILDNGETIKAKEEFPFEVLNKITNKKIELNFEN
ncbi:MAG: hypothetical protein CL772_06185 [Chloroflexi bacterium]|nr:hypothetical protein [Chloroflexota bacterium]|tara:strand:- start:5571 stop:6020 length:450 start_codon:yes stop_codon:yes gene_type:complete